MIFIRSQGQLGNQLFLFSAAKNVRKNREWIVAVGFVELAQFFKTRPKRVLWVPVPHRFDRKVKRVFKNLRKLANRFCDCEIVTTGEHPQVRRTAGCHWPLIFEFGLCQNEQLAPLDAVKNFVWQPNNDAELQEQVTQALSPLDMSPGSFGFCHVRLGDYRDFSAHGFSPVLPSGFFGRAIDRLRASHPEIPIVVLSDDTDTAAKMLANQSACYFPRLDERESFWVMMNAGCGVLSASTFSWWGARFARELRQGPFIAPEYWMGFRAQKWFPSEAIRATFLSYQPVPSNENG